MSRAIYGAFATIAAPALRVWLASRVGQGKEDPARIGERRGRTNLGRPPGPLAWVHAASLGESRSVLALVERLVAARRDLNVLFTTMTTSAAELIAEQPPPNTIHQFVPLDVPRWVERFLDRWRPDAAIWVEGELWPNLIAATRSRQIPMALINARLSARSFARWRRARAIFAAPLDAFAPCLAQSEADAERLRLLGATNARCLGNLKFDGAPLPVDGEELRRLMLLAGDRPMWLAASTHPGEEEIVADTHRAMMPRIPGLLTIIVPRHAKRGDEIAALLAGRGLGLAQRSKGGDPGPDVAVYLADTMGELGLFYRLARIAFIGGSLVRHGGQNPLEAARLDCALVFGPHMWNFRDIADALVAAGGAIEGGDSETLAALVGRLMADLSERARRAAAAAGIAAEGRGAIERVFAELAPLLSALPPPASESQAVHARA